MGKGEGGHIRGMSLISTKNTVLTVLDNSNRPHLFNTEITANFL